MTPADYGLSALALVMAGVLVTGITVAARRTARSAREAARLGGGVAAALAAWLALTAALAAAGVLSRWDSTPPRVALLPLTVLATMLALSGTRTFGELVAATPAPWPIALQTFRLPVEVLLWRLFLEGRIPERMTFAGRNLDVLVGLSAPLVAWAVSRGRVGRLTRAAWNVAGLGLLGNIVVLALRSAPGPLNAGWGGVPNTAIAELPFVWLPAFLVPLAVFGHVVALRQVVATRRPRPPARKEGAAIA